METTHGDRREGASGSAEDGRPRVVVVGGGFGGLEAAFYLRDRLEDRAAVTLIADEGEFVFKPYLSYVPFGLVPERLKVDLVETTHARGVRFVRGRVRAVDPVRKEVQMEEASLPYDFLVLATGARVRMDDVPGLEEYGYVLGREADLVLLRAALDHLLRDHAEGRPWRVVFQVSPEHAWAGPLYEMAFMLETWLHWKEARAGTEFVVSTPETCLMEALGPEVHHRVVDEFRRRDVTVRTQQVVVRVDPEVLHYRDGTYAPYDLLLVAPGLAPAVHWEGLPVDETGFLQTEGSARQVAGHPDVYAVGDGSDFPVKQAFLALLQADAAAEHIATRVLETEPDFGFDPSSVWVLEQFDGVLFTHVGLGPSREGDLPGHVEPLPVGQLRRLAMRDYLPWGLDLRNPLYAGLLWKGTEVGLKVLPHLMKS